MEVLHPRCAGLDVHRDSIVACARLVRQGRAERQVETFGTTTAELERLARWLSQQAVTHVALEATGVSWKPVWAVLAADFELLLANAMHVKAVPGRKTDVNDAMWLADLLAHGLIRASFVPPMAIQALRDLTRTRKQLAREKAAHVQRIDKLLQAANLKLGSVLSDILGASGRAILDALAQGESDPERLAAQVHTRIHASPAELVAALRGRLVAHQRLLLRLHLGQIDAIDAAIAVIDAEVGDRLEPFRAATLQPFPASARWRPPSSSRRSASIWPAFRRPRISSPGRGSARRTTRVPASAARPGCAKGRRGSRPSWSSAPGLPAAPRAAICAPVSIGSPRAAVPARPLWPSPPRSSPPSTGCSSAALSITTSAPITSTDSIEPASPRASPANLTNSASTSP